MSMMRCYDSYHSCDKEFLVKIAPRRKCFLWIGLVLVILFVMWTDTTGRCETSGRNRNRNWFWQGKIPRQIDFFLDFYIEVRYSVYNMNIEVRYIAPKYMGGNAWMHILEKSMYR